MYTLYNDDCLKTMQEMLNSCWFVWNKNYNGYPKIKVIDVDKYVLRKGEL